MQIIEISKTTVGVPLSTVSFGQVVTRGFGDCYYLVASPMDGSGRRVLVTLHGGTIREHPQDTAVTLVEASVVVGGKPVVP